MNVSVKYLGMIADIVCKSNEEIEIVENSKVSDLLSNLYKSYAALNSIEFRVALNQKLVDTNTSISSKDELALLPPFAGG